MNRIALYNQSCNLHFAFKFYRHHPFSVPICSQSEDSNQIIKISMGNLQRDHLFVPPSAVVITHPSEPVSILKLAKHFIRICTVLLYAQNPMSRILLSSQGCFLLRPPTGSWATRRRLPAFVTFHISPFVFFKELVTTCHLKTITSCLGFLFIFFSFCSKPYEPETEYTCLRLASAPLKDKYLLNESRRSERRRSWVSPDSSSEIEFLVSSVLGEDHRSTGVQGSGLICMYLCIHTLICLCSWHSSQAWGYLGE